MNPVAILGDSHFGIKPKNLDIFIKSQLKFFTDQFVPYLKKYNISTIFFLGDLFENRSTLNVMVKNAVFHLFNEYLKDFQIYLIVGNHDSYLNNSLDINSLKFFSKFSNVTVIEKMTLIEMNNRKIVLIPWITNNAEFISQFCNNSYDVCLGHLYIRGFNMGNNIACSDGLPADVFSKCNKVFSGHFHTRDKRNVDNTEIVYIGAPYQLTRSDIGENKGFTILDLDTLKYIFVNNNQSIQFKKLEYPNPFNKEEISGNIIDIYIDASKNYNDSDIEIFIHNIEEAEPATPPNIFIVNNHILGGEFDINSYNMGSMETLMKDYITTLSIENKDKVYDSLILLYKETKKELKE